MRNACYQVRDTGTRRRRADTRLILQSRTGVRHHGRCLFVANIDRPQTLNNAFGFDQQHWVTHDIEKIIDAHSLEQSGYDL